jgi:hypothetical protein
MADEVQKFDTVWSPVEPDFCNYMRQEWLNEYKLEKLIRASVDSTPDGDLFIVPTTTSAIESYHSHLKSGELAKRCGALAQPGASAPPPSASFHLG